MRVGSICSSLDGIELSFSFSLSFSKDYRGIGQISDCTTAVMRVQLGTEQSEWEEVKGREETR